MLIDTAFHSGKAVRFTEVDSRMRNALQEQLLKAGLTSEKKLKEQAHAKHKQKKQAGKGAAESLSEDKLAAQQALQEKAERDRLLAEQQKQAQAAREAASQIRQIIAHYRQSRDNGDIAYNFSDAGVVRKLFLSALLRERVIKGHLIIVRSGDGYELVPQVAAAKIEARDPATIVVWNKPAADDVPEDDPYKDFPIPDDLMW